MNYLFYFRDVVAGISSLFLIIAAVFLVQWISKQHVNPPTQSITISIVPTLESVAPAPPKVVLPIPKKIIPVSPQKTTHPSQVATEVPLLTPPPIIAKASPAPVLPTPTTPKPLVSNSKAEGEFVNGVKALIEENKIFPSTAQRLGMAGTVEVTYVINRQGKLVLSKVSVSSGYPLLDQAALNAVNNAKFKSFPVDAWVGEEQKEFHTKIIFTLDN